MAVANFPVYHDNIKNIVVEIKKCRVQIVRRQMTSVVHADSSATLASMKTQGLTHHWVTEFRSSIETASTQHFDNCYTFMEIINSFCQVAFEEKKMELQNMINVAEEVLQELHSFDILNDEIANLENEKLRQESDFRNIDPPIIAFLVRIREEIESSWVMEIIRTCVRTDVRRSKKKGIHISDEQKDESIYLLTDRVFKYVNRCFHYLYQMYKKSGKNVKALIHAIINETDDIVPCGYSPNINKTVKPWDFYTKFISTTGCTDRVIGGPHFSADQESDTFDTFYHLNFEQIVLGAHLLHEDKLIKKSCCKYSGIGWCFDDGHGQWATKDDENGDHHYGHRSYRLKYVHHDMYDGYLKPYTLKSSIMRILGNEEETILDSRIVFRTTSILSHDFSRAYMF
jgi:hypothetical protein